MEIMKPIASEDIPIGDDWLYEVKYDGFRCILHWEKNGTITLTSKNNHDLTANFPEVIDGCHKYQTHIKSHLPLTFDGELVILNNRYQANFPWMQKRARMKSTTSIQKAAKQRQATFIVFDLLKEMDHPLIAFTLEERKQRLHRISNIFKKEEAILVVETFSNADELRELVFNYKGEGIIAKRRRSKYIVGKSHRGWLKIKNWRTISGFLTKYNEENGYFTLSVFANGAVKDMGTCKHGLDQRSMDTLKELFLTNGEQRNSTYVLPPAICASVHTLDLYEGELREPNFLQLLPNTRAEECTYERAMLDLAMIPDIIDIQKTEKLFWPEVNKTKGDLLTYIREISPYMLPFLKNRKLTVIRCPDGVDGEHFFQKHLPNYAPGFIDGIGHGEESKIICNNLASLVWFANHGAIEFHIPFQYVMQKDPIEIVFDLDPPGREKFELATLASQLLKQILDDFELISFIKTSGNKGLQIHIPIPEGSMTYEEAGIFTQAIAYTLEQTYPNHFTTERMKKNRNDRLYIDYVQHGMDKTLIAPYSPRKTKDATVATPLYWDEVNGKLRPEQFTLSNVVERVQDVGCPFRHYFEVQKTQKLNRVLDFIRQ